MTKTLITTSALMDYATNPLSRTSSAGKVTRSLNRIISLKIVSRTSPRRSIISAQMTISSIRHHLKSVVTIVNWAAATERLEDFYMPQQAMSVVQEKHLSQTTLSPFSSKTLLLARIVLKGLWKTLSLVSKSRRFCQSLDSLITREAMGPIALSTLVSAKR